MSKFKETNTLFIQNAGKGIKNAVRIFPKMVLFAFFLFPSLLNAQHSRQFDSYPLIFQQGIELIQKEMYGAAKEKMDSFLKMEADAHNVLVAEAQYYSLLCAVQLNMKDANLQIENFAKQYSSSAWIPRVNFLEGRFLFEQKRYSEALAAFEKVDASSLAEFEAAELNYKAGFCLMRQNNIEKALQHLALAKEVKGAYQQPAIYYYGHLQYLQENDEEAAAHLEKLAQSPQYKRIVPQYLLHIKHRKGDYLYVTAEAEHVLGLTDNKHRPDILLLVADAWYKTDNFSKALEYYTKLDAQGRPRLSREHSYQKAICLFKAGNYSEAIMLFEGVAASAEDALAQNASYHLGLAYNETEQKTFARNAFLKAHKLTANQEISEESLFNYARLSMEANADPYNEAVSLLEKYVDDGGKRQDEAADLIVQLYLHSKNYDAALASIEKRKSRNPQLEKIYQQLSYNTGINFFQQNNYAKAIEYFTRLEADNTSDFGAKALFWKAEAQLQSAQYANAIQSLKKLESHRSDEAKRLISQAAYQSGYAHFQLKQYPQALNYFKKFTGSGAIDEAMKADSWLRIGDCHFIQKQYRQAIEAYNQVAGSQLPGSDYALLQNGLSYGAQGRFNDKITALDKLVKSHPSSFYYDQALYEIGSTNLIMNDPQNAIVFFDKLVRERPRSVYARDAMHKTGLIYFNNNQNDKAISHLKKVIEMYPGTEDARQAMNTLKAVYMDMNRLDEYISLSQKLGIGSISQSEEDSLAFTIAENFYLEGHHQKALESLQQYIQKQTNGAYLLKAHHYRYQLLLLANRTDEALQSLNYIIDKKGNPYAEQALLHSARIRYDAQQYAEAEALYNELYELSGQPEERMEALEGKMKSAYFTAKHATAIESAQLLLASPAATASQKLQANYIAAKSLFDTNRTEEAKQYLSQVSKNEGGQLGAEAAYITARISYNSNKLEEAENQIFDLSEKYAAQDYWVAKGFLLLADVYVKQNNIFQAKETLKSIVDNYKGEDLKQEAVRKLSMLH